MFNIVRLKRDILIFKILLIVMTFFQVAVILLNIFYSQLIFNLDRDYYFSTILGFSLLALIGIFTWYNWKKLPIERKKKVNNTWMLVLLGIFGFGVIGMWLWLPNKREIKKISQLPATSSTSSTSPTRESTTTGKTAT